MLTPQRSVLRDVFDFLKRRATNLQVTTLNIFKTQECIAAESYRHTQ